MAKQYKVRNVFEHPPDVPVISVRKRPGAEEFDHYRDGDIWAPRKHISQEAIDLMLKEGVVEEVKDHG